MKHRSTRAVAALGCAALVAAGCGSSEQADTGGGGSTQAQTRAAAESVAGKKVVLVTPSDINPWMKTYATHIQQGLEAEGVKVTRLQDPYDPTKNVQNLNLAISQRPDLVLEVPIDDKAIIPSLHRAQQAKVPVINLNGPPAPGAEELLAGSYEADHEALGRYAAQNIVEGLQKEGKEEANVIAITGNAASGQVPVRMAAFKKELAKHPGYKLVAVEDGNWDLATAAKLAQQLFAKYRSQGGIQAAYGMADNMALGIVQAAKQAGIPVGVKHDGLVVTGSNCFEVGLQAIEAGQMYGTATQAPAEQGDFSAKHALDYLRGVEQEPRIFAPEHRVTAETLAKSRPECP